MHTLCTLSQTWVLNFNSVRQESILTKWHNNATNIQTLSPRLCFRKKGKSFYICLFIVVANRISRYTTNVIIIINDKLINQLPSRCILRKYFLIINKTVDYIVFEDNEKTLSKANKQIMALSLIFIHFPKTQIKQ